MEGNGVDDPRADTPTEKEQAANTFWDS